MGQRTIYLIACVVRKHPAPMKARDLYSSTWFKKASELADRRGDQWFILSARHGLLDPDHVIEPYDLPLNSISATDRRKWAKNVVRSLLPRLSSLDRVVILAGKLYRENLVSPIHEHGCKVEIPMDGLRIGEQLGWLNEQLKE